MKIAVVGTGYVGLVTGTCFAEMGNMVTCIDIDADKVERMQAGHVPIYEPQLEELFSNCIAQGRLAFTTDLAEGIKGAKVIFLALPTPPNEDYSADLSYVLQVADKLGKLLKSYTVIVNKSTVPVGTAELVTRRIAKNAKVKFDVVSNPEFLKEGFAVEDFMKPDRIVVGTSSNQARKLMGELYAPFVRQGNPIIFMDQRSSEMTKYAANAFLAMKISFMNEIANLSELAGANVDEIRMGIGADERIGRRFLFPGIGYGGSCFPKDIKALYKTSKDHNYNFRILDAVMQVNDDQKKILVNKLESYYGGELSGRTFALWGLAFKPDTDDMREAPAIDIIDALIKKGAKVQAYDPEARSNGRQIYKGSKALTIVDEQYQALENADALLIATEWPVFRSPDFSRLKKLLKKPVIFDGRNLYAPAEMSSLGFHYESIGRGGVSHG